MTGPDPNDLHPLEAYPACTFLRPLAEGRPNLEIGAFTYYDDRNQTGDFFDRNVLHHYDFIGDRLIIGPFTAIAFGVQIHMNGGTHAMDGFSTFPFNIFGKGWDEGFDPSSWEAVRKGDTTIGPDVWIGTEARLMPGLTIGAGAIIAAGSTVTQDIRPYTLAAGNPAREIRQRFDNATIAQLLEIAWWDWPTDKISRNLNAIRGANLSTLKAAQ